MRKSVECYLCLEPIIWGEQRVEWDTPRRHYVFGWQHLRTRKQATHKRCRDEMEQFELFLIQNDEDDIAWIVEQGAWKRNLPKTAVWR